MEKKLIILAVLMVAGPAFADCWQVGTCKSANKVYRDVTFKVDQCSDLTETVELQKQKRGLLVKEKDKEEYNIIYSDDVAAPESVYIECSKHMAEDEG